MFAVTDSSLPITGFHRLTAVFVAPWSGAYRFNVTTNGHSELWVSGSTDDATTAVSVAVASKASVLSTEVSLVKGMRYYFEVLGQGNDVSLGAVLARALFNQRDTVNAIDERQELVVGFDRILEVQELTLQNPGTGHAVVSMNGKSAVIAAQATEPVVKEAVESLFDVACSVSQDASTRVFGGDELGVVTLTLVMRRWSVV